MDVSNATISTPTPEDVHVDMVSVLVTAIGTFCLLALFCYCSSPTIPDERFHRNAEQIQEQMQQIRDERAGIEKTQFSDDPTERAKIVKQSLIRKKVISSDPENGSFTLGDPDPVSEENLNSTTTTSCIEINEEIATSDSCAEEYCAPEVNYANDDNESTCVICLDSFCVGDHVAFSKFTPDECLHVFHEECIVEWLSNNTHDDCPSCRTVILRDPSINEDNEEGCKAPSAQQPSTNSTIDSTLFGNDTKNVPAQNSQNNVFVIMHGLISHVASRVSTAATTNYTSINQNEEPAADICNGDEMRSDESATNENVCDIDVV